MPNLNIHPVGWPGSPTRGAPGTDRYSEKIGFSSYSPPPPPSEEIHRKLIGSEAGVARVGRQ